MVKQNPEVAGKIKTGVFESNYHDNGEGFPVILIHGSGPGVSSWANWGKVMGPLSKNRRVLGLDMAGFGFTERRAGTAYTLDLWTRQVLDFMEALGIKQADLVGNSFGGAIALSLAINHPESVRKLVLMGAMGVRFEITEGLDRVWGYEPSFENMRGLLDLFAYNREIVNDDLARMRYEASIRSGFQESFGAMFPVPRQRFVDALAKDEDRIHEIQHPTLIIHGREDKVIPLETSLKLIRLIPEAQLHIFGHCGHWTQIERTAEFNGLLDNFLSWEGEKC